MAPVLPEKFGPLADQVVAATFRQGTWRPAACRWCSAEYEGRPGPGYVCPCCDRSGR